jgi:diguanylate cyclase (GGDEF)-like protein
MTASIEPSDLILIIDDQADTIRLLSGMLNDLGDILFATSGEAGIELARLRRPQLILLDVEMPDLDGYAVCRRLKQHPDTQDCAVIFVTGNNSMESEVAGLEAGAVDFITKPLNPPVVRARVQTHLKLQRHTAALTRLAHRDGLTGLHNRRHFNEQLEREFQRHRRQHLPLGLALIDIDHFKAFNDGYGHLEGDRCLREVADAIGSATRRPGEFVARYGGEEFVVILPYTGADEAQKYGEWICERIRALHLVHEYARTGFVTVSIGVASCLPTDGADAQSLLGDADRALYQAKADGRNCSRMAAGS